MEQTRSSVEATTNRGEPEITRTYDATPASVPVVTTPGMIDRYVLHSLIGQGGFGQVFLAFDPQLQRQLAIKIPRFSRNWKSSQTDEFLREARLAVRLAHANVVTIHDVGISEEYGFYIAMEFVDGESLQRRLQRGRLSLAETTNVIAGIAAAMHYAHKRGVIHRDLKPANVLMEKSGHIKVTDFGLAVAEELQSQHEGEVSGTPAYMSPEQVRGDVHQLDGRSDLWSMGVILYECLTGRRPFQGDNWPAIREEILTRSPKPPRQIDDSIPPAVELICLACLEKDPHRRPTTTLDVARILSDSVCSDPTHKRHTLLKYAAVFVAATILIYVSGGLFFFNPKPSPRDGTNRNKPESPVAAAFIPSDGAMSLSGQEKSIGPVLSAMKPFCFDHGSRGNTYFFDPVQRDFHIETPTYSAFIAQPQSSSSFFLESEARITSSAHFGVLWNIQEISPEPMNDLQNELAQKGLPQAGLRYQPLNHAFSACAAYLVRDDQERPARVRIGRLTFAGTTPDTVALVKNGFIEEIDVVDDNTRSTSRLSVEVEDRELKRVWFQGNEVPITRHQEVLASDPRGMSSIGLLAAHGSIQVVSFAHSRKGSIK